MLVFVVLIGCNLLSGIEATNRTIGGSESIDALSRLVRSGLVLVLVVDLTVGLPVVVVVEDDDAIVVTARFVDGPLLVAGAKCDLLVVSRSLTPRAVVVVDVVTLLDRVGLRALFGGRLVGPTLEAGRASIRLEPGR